MCVEIKQGTGSPSSAYETSNDPFHSALVSLVVVFYLTITLRTDQYATSKQTFQDVTNTKERNVRNNNANVVLENVFLYKYSITLRECYQYRGLL